MPLFFINTAQGKLVDTLCDQNFGSFPELGCVRLKEAQRKSLHNGNQTMRLPKQWLGLSWRLLLRGIKAWQWWNEIVPQWL